ncbi:dual specificity phosphatase 28 [Aphelocoma coerulescens]
MQPALGPAWSLYAPACTERINKAERGVALPCRRREPCTATPVRRGRGPWLPMLQLCQVTASLLLGTARAACDEELLAREGVTFCVNVTRQQPFPRLQRVRGIRVPVFDDPAEDLYRYFEPCGAAIEEAVRGGGKCLVYCKNGRSRSAAICTAYLMRHRQLPLKDAFEAVKTARPVAEPNAGFWSQLQRYEEDLQIPKQSALLSKGLKNSNV